MVEEALWVGFAFAIEVPSCLLSPTFIKRLFSSCSLSALRVVSSAYLRLLIFLLAILKQELELGMEQQTGSKLGKEYVKAAYLTYMQSTSCEMLGTKHKLKEELIDAIRQELSKSNTAQRSKLRRDWTFIWGKKKKKNLQRTTLNNNKTLTFCEL